MWGTGSLPVKIKKSRMGLLLSEKKNERKKVKRNLKWIDSRRISGEKKQEEKFHK